MVEIFIKVVNLSITASWLILAVLLVRFLLKKAPKWIHCALWGMVGLRLLVPFSPESIFSLVPSAETFEPEIIHSPKFTINTGISGLDHSVNEYLGDRYYEGATVASNLKWDVAGILAIVWLIGIAVLAGYAFYSYMKLKRDMCTATPLKDNVYQSEKVGSPFVLGLVRPVIYLPYVINDEDMQYVIAHENAHIKRKDHWIKPIGYLILCVYWFNPLLWAAYVLLCKDIELACDEKVVRALGVEERQNYSMALLNCSLKRFHIAACPLAFGEVSVKERIKSVMNYKKPAFWITIVGVISCMVVALCFLTNPKEDSYYAGVFGYNYHVEEIVYDAPQYSFTYTPDSAPEFQLTSEGKMFAKEGTVDWALLGSFSEVKLTKSNFDEYFRPIDNVNGPASWIDGEFRETLRKENKQAWRLDVSEHSDSIVGGKAVFYYLLYQENGDVYLTIGYDAEESDATPHIRWLFKLEKTELISVAVGTSGQRTVINWYKEDTMNIEEAQPYATVYVTGYLEVEVPDECDTITVEEHYYKYEDGSIDIKKNTYELTKDKDGKFVLALVSMGKEQDEEAIYYVGTPNGKFAIKVLFALEDTREAV